MRQREYTAALALQSTRYHTYLKGKEYFRSGKVDIVSQDEQRVTAIVTGSDEYKIVLTWDHEDLLYECSCPVDNDKSGACKHVVATILYLAKDGDQQAKKIESKNIWKLPDLTLDEARKYITSILV